MSFWTYILECSDRSYYVGHTDDIDRRLGQHAAGLGGYTATRLPVTLRWSGMFSEREAAFAFERRLKGWSRAKKEAVIRGDWDALPGLARTAKGRVEGPAGAADALKSPSDASTGSA
ncbi:MAG: GIY-YIG nuclease family protein [Sphingomonadaceae bacterium]|nr:GIY-YIG nuclease family protein [Sphingomonadaceae bacterium]